MAKRDFLRRLGPGIVTGAADDDPSGIGTYTSAGATAGYGFLWSAVWLLPLAFAVQEACARLALVTGKGLASIIKTRMPSWVLVVSVLLVAIANTVNIAANLSIMSAALGFLMPIEQWAGVVFFAVVLGVTEIYIPYHRYAKVLRWVCLSPLIVTGKRSGISSTAFFISRDQRAVTSFGPLSSFFRVPKMKASEETYSGPKRALSRL